MKLALSHPPACRLPLLSPGLRLPSQPKTGIKLYCLVTEAHACEQLAPGCYLDANQPKFKPATFWVRANATVKPHRPQYSIYGKMVNHQHTIFVNQCKCKQNIIRCSKLILITAVAVVTVEVSEYHSSSCNLRENNPAPIDRLSLTD